MEHVKIVIGSGFGDEGKGLATSFFAKNASGTVLNVLFNGGPQRGHTVYNHVFHAFGSASFDGADTYCNKDFMVNPIAWSQELSDIKNDIKVSDSHKRYLSDGHIYVHEDCLITTPYDVIINRLIESKRGSNRHGSCGMGIWETNLRSKRYPIKMKDLNDQSTLYNKLKFIRDKYVPERCSELGIDEFPLFSIDEFIKECYSMINSVLLISNESEYNLYKLYNTIIFEGSQGLLLSEDNEEYMPYLTASHTGSKNISEFINKLDESVDVEVCYITRSYMTRHGAGKFLTECSKNDINPLINDTTNIHNEYQESLRFGYLDLNLIKSRVVSDQLYYKRKISTSMLITWLNYTNGKLITGNNNYEPISVIDFVDRIYPFYHCW